MRRILGNGLALIVLGVALSSTQRCFALTYSSDVDVSFTFNPALSISLSSTDLIIPNLAPGTVEDSNEIIIRLKTNSVSGLILNASVGNDTDFDTRDLIHENSNVQNSFESVDVYSSYESKENLGTDTWAFSVGQIISHRSSSLVQWSPYSGLPLYSDIGQVLTLYDSFAPTDDEVFFKIAAKASTAQSAGEYNNVINYYVVANFLPEEKTCPGGYICYHTNAPDSVVDTMGDQSIMASDTSATLWASNFQRPGYGFAGWSETYDYSDYNKFHGPNETISFTAGKYSSEGLSLYAIWVQSSGTMQAFDNQSCANLNGTIPIGAFTDSRDNQTYVIAKLADGNCWMIENLRLSNVDNKNQAIVFNSTNTNNPTSSFALSASQDPTITAWCTTNSSACNNQPMLFTGNTVNYANPMTASNSSTPVYSYGNYYNWYTATAGNGTYPTTVDEAASGDICPAGWHLPNGSQNSGSFYYLASELGVNGSTASNTWRSFPQNFIKSGYVSGSSMDTRSGTGEYWTSMGIQTGAVVADFINSYVYPGNYGNNKYAGLPVRCIIEPNN